MTSIRYRHFTLEQYEAKAEARFWAKVEKTATCWVWTGRATTNGYGAHSFTEYQSGRIKENVKRHEVRAHRYSWEKAKGPIPDGMEIDHVCHNRLCVRPSHLRITTRKQNAENRSGLGSNNTSGVRGVRWVESRGRWRATVGHDGKSIHVGNFIDLAEAEAAVIAKRNELHTHNDVDRQR
jgi:hypothetical protein